MNAEKQGRRMSLVWRNAQLPVWPMTSSKDPADKQVGSRLTKCLPHDAMPACLVASLKQFLPGGEGERVKMQA